MVAMAAASGTSSLTSAMVVKCSSISPSAHSTTTGPAKLGHSRRLLIPALICAPLLLQQQQAAMAKDIPLFGIRKRVEQAEKEVVKEVKQLVKEGEQLVKEGEKEISSVVAPAVASKPAFDSPPPAFQAAAVAGAELVAVLVASSVVNGLVRES